MDSCSKELIDYLKSLELFHIIQSMLLEGVVFEFEDNKLINMYYQNKPYSDNNLKIIANDLNIELGR